MTSAHRRNGATPLAWAASVFVVFSLAVAGSAAGAHAARGLRLTDAAGGTAEWWRPDSAPAHWRAPGLLAKRASWRRASEGVEWAELPVSGAGEASAIRLVALRLDPRRLAFALRWGIEAKSGRPSWTLADAPHDATVAFNAGMFVDALPWGWVVSRGAELLPPGRAPLASAVVVRRDGTLAMPAGDALDAVRASGDVLEAFQSYPTLLTGDGDVPRALREGEAIDRTHRDARLAFGLDRDGRALLVLTRLDLGFAPLERLPVGLTVPEMAAVMGSLGAQRAVLLDGGISAQVQLREANGTHRAWRGSRAVPLALVVRGR